jgi:hypothetical protein
MCLFFSGLMIIDQQLDRNGYGNTTEVCGLTSIAVRYFLTERIPDYINATYCNAQGTVSPINASQPRCPY